MDKQSAKLLLENLLARIVIDPESGRGTLAGVVTPMEIEALQMASGRLLESESVDIVAPVLKTPEPEIQTEEKTKPETTVEQVPVVEADAESVSEPESVPEPELKTEHEAEEPQAEIGQEQEVEPVQGINQSLHMAGDIFDSAIEQAILEKAGVRNYHHSYSNVSQHLRKQVLSLREDLFRDGYCVVNLVNGARVRVELDDFLRQDSVNRFKKSLTDKFEDVQEVEPIPEPELKTEPEVKELQPEIEQEQKVEPVPEPEIELNLDSLKFHIPQNPNIRMCLDFGTAMSKAFATEIEGNEVVEGLKVKLGHRGSGGTSKHIYPVPSSLWIGDDGNIYLGEEAIARSLHADPSGNRQRFDSLKRELILGMKESSPFQQLMNDSLNPTDVPLSNGDAITLYLGYLTDLTCTEMEEMHKCSRYILRNFGLPSWAPERRSWGEDLLRKMLIKAQIVADTFHGEWVNGVSIHAVKSVLDKIDKLEKLPEYLVGEGITEPLAVGSSRLRQDEPSRGLVMVVDIGAGTSDLALFVVVEDPERNLFNAFPVQGCNQSLHMAGDTLDSAMQQAILKKAEVRNHDHDYPYIIQHLRKQVRSLKEDLFRDGYCVVNLVNGVRVVVELDEFLRQDSVNRFKKSLADKFEDVLKGMSKGIAKHFGSSGLSVVLTGGGATLPMVKALAEGSLSVHNTQIRKNEVAMVPEDFEDDAELATVYPQLAVAIGGTMPFLIDEKKTIDDMSIPQGGFTLSRTQVTGV